MIDKKKLKEEYKNLIPEKGVFVIRNMVNSKVLLCSSMNLKNQYEAVKLMLKIGNFFNTALQNDWNTYGEDSFEYEVLETLKLNDDRNYNYSEDLEILEMILIDKFKPFSENCYNKNEKIRIL
jgi:hypothetical protein